MQKSSCSALATGAALIAAAFTSAHMARAQSGLAQDSDPPAIIVNGIREIVVNGRARQCYPLRNDPRDQINVRPGPEGPRRGAIVAVGDGQSAFQPDSEQITGPEYWQRSGLGIHDYVFRMPPNDKPMCIGGKFPEKNSYAGFRRITDAAPYRGKRIRFTAWVATGQARWVTFFLAAGTGQTRLYNGGTTNNQGFGGDHGWTPVLLEVGPISEDAEHISYGLHLHGPGNVWVYKPQLEIVEGPPMGGGIEEVVMIGGNQR